MKRSVAARDGLGARCSVPRAAGRLARVWDWWARRHDVRGDGLSLLAAVKDLRWEGAGR